MASGRHLSAASYQRGCTEGKSKSGHRSNCGFCQVRHSRKCTIVFPLREALRATPPGGFTISASPCTAELCTDLQSVSRRLVRRPQPALCPTVLSGGFPYSTGVDLCVPWRSRFHHRVQDGEELAHRCRYRHFLYFPTREQPVVERVDHRVTSCGCEGGHVQDRADLRPPRPCRAPERWPLSS